MEKKSRGTELRVGIFVVAALLIGGTLAFVIGNQSNLFRPKTTFRAVFDEVDGLRAGNSVRVAGVVVGTVESVRFTDDGRLEAQFRVLDSARELLRGDPENVPDLEDEGPQPTRVAIGSKGLLGDKLLDLSVGDRSLPPWPAETPMILDESAGLLERADAVAEEVQATARNLRRLTDPFSDQEFSNDMKAIADNLAQVTGMLAAGEGTAGRFLADAELGDDVAASVRNTRQLTGELAAAAGSTRRIVREVETGDGSVHALIYGDEGRATLENVARASDELAQLVADVRGGDGTIHDLVYEDLGNDLVSNLTEVSEDLAAITEDVRQGRGTIGGLLVDPSIYEDVKRLVGDLQRNEILRALVRYSIRRDEADEETEAAAR
ncbi:MAG: MlaD family protein [Myxococcota bacterium]